jgi:hypothetical protein
VICDRSAGQQRFINAGVLGNLPRRGAAITLREKAGGSAQDHGAGGREMKDVWA